MVEVVNELLVNCKMPSRKMISNLIAIELAYINTNHPDFVGGGGAISKIFEKMARQDQVCIACVTAPGVLKFGSTGSAAAAAAAAASSATTGVMAV